MFNEVPSKKFLYEATKIFSPNEIVTSDYVAKVCRFDVQTTKNVMKFLELSGYITNFVHGLGENYPRGFMITQAGYNWLQN